MDDHVTFCVLLLYSTPTLHETCGKQCMIFYMQYLSKLIDYFDNIDYDLIQVATYMAFILLLRILSLTKRTSQVNNKANLHVMQRNR